MSESKTVMNEATDYVHTHVINYEPLWCALETACAMYWEDGYKGLAVARDFLMDAVNEHYEGAGLDTDDLDEDKVDYAVMIAWEAEATVIDFEPFKGRTVEHGERVQVYRNLNRKGTWWSIRGPEGLVRGHARGLTLLETTTYVNPTAQARIAAGGAREVHAWINGTLAINDPPWNRYHRVEYNPKLSPHFFYAGGFILSTSLDVVFTPEGAFV